MDGPDWKRKNVRGPQAVNGLDFTGYGRSGLKKSRTVPSLTDNSKRVKTQYTRWEKLLERQAA